MATIATTPPSTAVPSGTPTSTRRRRFHYSDNVYFLDGHVVIGILLLLLYLIVAVSLDAAGYVGNMTLLVWTTLGAFVLGLLMSFSRFDGFFALSHSLFTGLAWILFLMTNIVSSDEIAPFISNGIPPLQAKAYIALRQACQGLHGIDKLPLYTLPGNEPLLAGQAVEQVALGCAVPVAQQHCRV